MYNFLNTIYLYQKNLPGGRGGRWVVGRGVGRESQKGKAISAHIGSINGTSSRRTCQVGGEGRHNELYPCLNDKISAFTSI